MARWSVRVSAIALLVLAVGACSQLSDAPTPDSDVIVVTAGSPAPEAVGGGGLRPMSTLENAQVSVGGSSTTPVSFPGLGCTVDTPTSVKVTVSYSVSGRQVSPASFDIYSVWTYDGDEFEGSAPVTMRIAPAMGSPRTHTVDIWIENAMLLGSGTTTIVVAPFNLVTNQSDPNGLQLSLDFSSRATVHVAFVDCAVENTKPNITVPYDLTAEATWADGAEVDFEVFGNDLEDGELTPVCFVEGAEVQSGHRFPIGASKVDCTVEDSGGLTASDHFHVYVQDTTPPEFTAFPPDVTEIVATDIHGYALDLSEFTITAADHGSLGPAAGEISPPVDVACTVGGAPAEGFQIAIGQTATVTCTATDRAEYRAPEETTPAPNATTRTFDVHVTLDVSAACGFEPPLRTEAPYSAHKANSTVPHKFCPPAYRDGTPATDLAGGLRLVLRAIGAAPASDAIEANDFATGSTTWRLADGRYVFNLKTDRNWAPGQYETTVSFQGVELATTEFALRK